MKCLLTSLIVIILLLVIANSSNAQETVHCLDLENPSFDQFDVFDQDVENMKIVVLGEFHYLKSNHLIQAELWMHLNKQFGIRHLLIEFGRSEAYLYNQYLKTGDVKYLQKTTYGVRDFKAFFEYWKKLYAYNLNLSDEKKLVVHGLDLEREPAISFALHELLSQYPTNDKLDALLTEIQTRIDTIQIVRENKEYIAYLKTSIEDLSLPNNRHKITIDDIIYNESFFSNMSARDKFMAEAFIELDTLNEAYFGQFGLAHTMLNVYHGFTGILNNTEDYKGKLLVTSMYPLDTQKPVSKQFTELSKCKIFFYKFDPSDNRFIAHKPRGQWALILKDQPRYPPQYGSSNSK